MSRPKKNRPLTKGPFVVTALPGSPVGSSRIFFPPAEFTTVQTASGTYVSVVQSSLQPNWDNVQDVPVDFPPAAHIHTLVDVADAGGAAALDVGATAGTVAAGDDTRFHVAAAASSTNTVTLDVSGQVFTADVEFGGSIDADGSGLRLVGDQDTPGNSRYYGTDGSGSKGWFGLPSGGVVVFRKNDLGAGWDGGGEALTTGHIFRRPVERACVVKATSIVADQSGSCTVTVRKYTPSGGALGSSTSLGTVVLSSAVYARATGLSWALAEGDVLEFEITSTSMVERVTVTLKAEVS